MATRRKKAHKTIPELTIADMLLLRKYAMYLHCYIEKTTLPKDVWVQVEVLIEKLEALIRNGQTITREELDVIKKNRKTNLYDERNILIYAMIFYRNEYDSCDDYECFVMRDLENKLGNPHYYKEGDIRRMSPEWFSEMELKRQNRQLLDY